MDLESVIKIRNKFSFWMIEHSTFIGADFFR